MEKNIDLMSYAKGAFALIAVNANTERAKEMRRIVRDFKLDRKELGELITALKSKGLLPTRFHFNGGFEDGK